MSSFTIEHAARSLESRTAFKMPDDLNSGLTLSKIQKEFQFCKLMQKSKLFYHISRLSTVIEFFLNNTNLTFLVFLYKIDNRVLKFQQKIKLPPVGIELTTPTITGLEF